jgi:hypothetical protein
MEMTFSSTWRETTIPGFLRMSKEGLWTWQNSFLDQVWHRLPLVIPGGVAGVLGALVSARSTSGHISQMFNR